MSTLVGSASQRLVLRVTDVKLLITTAAMEDNLTEKFDELVSAKNRGR